MYIKRSITRFVTLTAALLLTGITLARPKAAQTNWRYSVFSGPDSATFYLSAEEDSKRLGEVGDGVTAKDCPATGNGWGAGIRCFRPLTIPQRTCA